MERKVVEETGSVIIMQSGLISKAEEYQNNLHERFHCYHVKVVDNPGKFPLADRELVNRFKALGCGIDRYSNSEPPSATI